MIDPKTKKALEEANRALDDQIVRKQQQKNEEDRKFIIANIGNDLVSILTPLLQDIALNAKITSDEMKSIISQIKVEAPVVNVEPANVSVTPSKIEVPKIEFPKIELIAAMKQAIGTMKFPKIDVKTPEYPKEMKVAKIQEVIDGLKKLADAKMTVEFSDKYNRDNPLPVILTDEKGVFYKAITEIISSSGGGGFGIGALRQIDGRLQIDVSPGTYHLAGNTLHLRRYYTSAGAVVDGIVWSPAADKRWYATDIFVQVSTDSTVTLEDDLAAGDAPFWSAELAANSGWSHSFTTPLFSGEDGADMIITSTAGNIYVTVSGYEI